LAEEMELAEGTHREKMPSDGTTTVAFADWLVRAGVFECFGNVLDRTKPRDVGKLKVSDFKTIGKEKVANRATTIIQLKIEGLDYPNGVTCKLWLDDQLNVPLKRLAEGVKGNFRLLETYGQWNFDPKQPDNTFTLPK
ncbi:MAG TPA: hypothetical protein VE988_23220, partial [Gemmataceae bacterium]|nr:hypothetical protein [Gemmataceae bacterium]